MDHMGRGAETKRKKNWSKGIDPLAANLERSPINRELLEAGTTKQEGGGQREPTKGSESQHGTANVGPKGIYRRGANGRQRASSSR